MLQLSGRSSLSWKFNNKNKLSVFHKKQQQKNLTFCSNETHSETLQSSANLSTKPNSLIRNYHCTKPPLLTQKRTREKDTHGYWGALSFPEHKLVNQSDQTIFPFISLRLRRNELCPSIAVNLYSLTLGGPQDLIFFI